MDIIVKPCHRIKLIQNPVIRSGLAWLIFDRRGSSVIRFSSVLVVLQHKRQTEQNWTGVLAVPHSLFNFYGTWARCCLSNRARNVIINVEVVRHEVYFCW